MTGKQSKTRNRYLHAALIQSVLDDFPEVGTKGFVTAVQHVLGYWPCAGPLIPDAFVVHKPEKSILIWEVEVNSGLTWEKMGAYRHLAWCLNDDYWALNLIVIDKWGTETTIDVLMADIQHQLSGLGPEAFPLFVGQPRETGTHI